MSDNETVIFSQDFGGKGWQATWLGMERPVGEGATQIEALADLKSKTAYAAAEADVT